MHTLIHHQLQAPVYWNIKHAWYAAKLTAAHDVFYNINQDVFPAKWKPENVNAASMHSLNAHGVTNMCLHYLQVSTRTLQAPHPSLMVC